jgi:hypothetical protein
MIEDEHSRQVFDTGKRMITRPGTVDDIRGILVLQKANLHDNLSFEERKRGFVTTPFSEAQLKELVKQRGVFVAEEGDEIAGYAMAGSWSYFAIWPIFPYMVSRLGSLTFSGKPLLPGQSFQYGPVCIAIAHRGTGLFPRLFEEMRLALSTRYPVGVTFINRMNEHSFMAHTRTLGLTVIDEFEFAGRNYYGLAFDTSRSVLTTG